MIKYQVLDFGTAIKSKEVLIMTKKELKKQIDELMRQYADEEIDGATYLQEMMELTTSARGKIEEDDTDDSYAPRHYGK